MFKYQIVSFLNSKLNIILYIDYDLKIIPSLKEISATIDKLNKKISITIDNITNSFNFDFSKLNASDLYQNSDIFIETQSDEIQINELINLSSSEKKILFSILKNEKDNSINDILNIYKNIIDNNNDLNKIEEFLRKTKIQANIGSSNFRALANVIYKKDNNETYVRIDIGLDTNLKLDTILDNDIDNLHVIIYNMMIHELTHLSGLSMKINRLLGEQEAVLIQNLLGKKFKNGYLKNILNNDLSSDIRNEKILDYKEYSFEKLLDYLNNNIDNISFISLKDLNDLKELYSSAIETITSQKKHLQLNNLELLQSRSSDKSSMLSYFTPELYSTSNDEKIQLLKQTINSKIDGSNNKELNNSQEENYLLNSGILRNDNIWSFILDEYIISDMKNQELLIFISKMTNVDVSIINDYIEKRKNFLNEKELSLQKKKIFSSKSRF